MTFKATELGESAWGGDIEGRGRAKGSIYRSH